MADAKDCPHCGLVNPPETQICDCGYIFFVHRQFGPTRIVPAQACQSCGVVTELRHVTLHQNIGVLIMRFHSLLSGHMCKTCIFEHFLRMTGITIVFSWWGIISFVLTPFILINNIIRCVGCLGMADAPQMPALSTPTTSSGEPLPTQLIGQPCSRCGQRIMHDMDSQFCRACGLPIHDRCIRLEAADGCQGCGRIVTPANNA